MPIVHLQEGSLLEEKVNVIFFKTTVPTFRFHANEIKEIN